MKEINAIKIDKSEFGSLFPRYDKESNILEVSSKKKKPWVYGFDIDGNIIFDADENFTIENFDVLISKDFWNRCKSITKPLAINDGSIKIEKSVVKQKSFHRPDLKIFFDSKAKEILILLDSNDLSKIPNFSGVKTSNSCIALLDERILKGFILNL